MSDLSPELIESLNALTNVLGRSSSELEHEVEGRRRANAATDSMKASLDMAGKSAKEFYQNMMTAGGGMSKYNGAINSAGDAALNLGKSFGPLGIAIGGAIKVFTSLTGAVLKQNDAILKSADSLAQIGVVGNLTSTDLLNLGKKAGYASGELDKWSDITKSLGTDIISLGLSATDGAKMFGKLTAMDTKMLEQYSRLGISQEQLNKNQADYIKLQAKSGLMISQRIKDDGTLRKASIDYTDNLLELASFTGMEVDEIKKKQEANRQDLAVSTRLAILQDQEEKLRAKHLDGEADQIAKQRKAITELQDMAAAIGMTGDEMAGFNSMLATGNFNELSAGFAAGTPGILEFIKAVESGKKEPYEFAKFMADATKRTRNSIGEAIIQDKTIGKAYAYSEWAVKNEAKLRDKSSAEIKKSWEDEKAAREKNKKDGTDATKDARAAQLTAERNMRLVMTEFTQMISGPITSAFTTLQKAVKWAAKGLASIASWLLRDDSILRMFRDLEEIGTDISDNRKSLDANAAAIKADKAKLDGYLNHQERDYTKGHLAQLEKERVKLYEKENALLAEKQAKEKETGQGPGARSATGAGGSRGISGGRDFSVTIDKGNGEQEIRTGGTKSWRNNNPGNIRAGNWAMAHGAISESGGMAVFPSEAAGNAARMELLFGAGSKYASLSLQDAIYRYAPPSENDSASYLATVAKALGVDPSVKLSSLNDAQKKAMLDVMKLHEGWKEGTVETKHGAAFGGVFNGSRSGYGVQLHGREAVVPLPNPNSKITVSDGGSTKQALASVMGNNPAAVDNSMDNLVGLTADMITILSAKLDSVIDRLGESNNLQDQLLKYSRT